MKNENMKAVREATLYSKYRMYRNSTVTTMRAPLPHLVSFHAHFKNISASLSENL